MLRRLQALFVLGMCLVSIRASAQAGPTGPAEPKEDNANPSTQTPNGGTPAGEATLPQAVGPNVPAEPAPTATPSTPEVKPNWLRDGWHTQISGYFRAPMALGISSRPNPDNPNGPSSTQISYGPNRTFDESYYSFAYTRLQEQDWAEVFIHEKHKHVEAVVGWMGYWFQSVGFQNPDAAWLPGMAYVVLDTDFDMAGYKPNIELTTGAWWPKFGYFEKYDTYTLGRIRQLGEQLKLTVPVTPDLTVDVLQGFGTGRDGSFNLQAPPLYGAITGVDLITWENIHVRYKKSFDFELHYNTQWTADPNLNGETVMGPKSYTQVQLAHLTVLGAELNLTLPTFGHLWLSPSIVSVRNGWALGSAGTEVVHSLAGAGVATNYLAWADSPGDSTGSGTLFNLGFLYENTLSGIQGHEPGTVLPDLTLNVFGLLTDASLDLPAGTTIKGNSLKEFKYGADVTLQAKTWLAFTLRYDTVNLDMDTGGYIFAVVTPRVTVYSHFLSGERIYLQYSRYFYGDNIKLGALWPSGTPLAGIPLVAGNDVLQGGPYVNKKPDEDVVKLQAEVAF